MDEAYRFHFSHLCIRWSLLGEVVRLGLPAGIQSSITAISNLYIQQYINSFSAVAIAGIGSAMRIDQFAGMVCFTLGLAMTTFIGQNIGAGRYDRTHKSVLISFISCAVWVFFVGSLIFIFSDSLVRVFSPDPEVIKYGSGMLHVIMPFYLTMGTMGLFGGILRGYRYSISSMVCTIVGMVACRQIWLAITLNHIAHDIRFVYFGYPVGWICSLVPMVLIYLISIRGKYPSKAGSMEASAGSES